MKTRTAALMGAAAALTVGPAMAAPEISAQPAVPGASSYADLLQPIPNAVERLRIADLQEQQAPAARLIEAGYGQPMAHHHHHHHHHHNRRWYMSHGYVWLNGAWVLRPPHHHHHHHHHHQQY